MSEQSVERRVLPIRRPPFDGVMARTLAGSRPDWNQIGHVRPPAGAPNVLLVLIDDAGFGNPGAFGGPVRTPNFDRLAADGLRYNRFHVTALCSPTRAALLTGRNHHTVGFGSVGEFSTGFPGYSAFLPKDCAPLPRILGENGYATAAFGKWHLTPDGQQGPAGPFDRWPSGWGFDHFWGFLGGESGQFDPVLVRDNTVIGVPDREGYYFPDDMADKTVEWLHGMRAQDADKPWFVYFSTGCSHAPHQVPAEWAERYRGRFDAGWDAYREETFERQKRAGVVPADAVLTPRHDAFPAWESLDEDRKRLYARQMEVYAGYQENTDWNVGRVIAAIQEMGELDNTLVIWIWGDNGASMEGTITGSFNEMTMLNGLGLTAEHQLDLAQRHGGLPAWGSDAMAPHYAAAWAWAGNCPFQWGKQVASHLGGTRDPMVVHWPGRVADTGAVRSHFTHVIDVAPTILEVAGIPRPDTVDGVGQEPMHGVTFADSIGSAAAPERHTRQYFEILGNRAMYADGWWLSMRMPRIPWDATAETLKRFMPGAWDPDADPVELYYLPDDFTQARDLAAEHPEKVAELRDLFWQEAERYRVLPLLSGFSVWFGMLPPLPPLARYIFHGDVQNVASGMIPRVYGHSYTISADLIVPAGGGEGVIVAEADHLGGFSLFVRDGRLCHTYSMMGMYVYRQQAADPLPTGEVHVALVFAADEARPGTGGQVTLLVDDRPVGGGRMEHTVPVRFSAYAGLDIGRDNGLPVDGDYADRSPFPFTGTIKTVVFDIHPHEDMAVEHALHEHAHRSLAVHGING